MPLTPGVLRIKRKRTDEPIDSLYIEELEEGTGVKKPRYRGGPVFLRQQGSQEYEFIASTRPTIPSIRATQPGDEWKRNGVPGQERKAVGEEQALQTYAGKNDRRSKSPRRFHLDRTPNHRSSKSLTGRGTHMKGGEGVAVLVEGAPKRKHTEIDNDSPPMPPKAPAPGENSPISSRTKRPKTQARLPKTKSDTSKQDNQSMDPRFEAAMVQYALEEVGKSTWSRPPSDSAKAESAKDNDTTMEDADEDYVFDTFIRQSTEPTALQSDGLLERVGYLVIEKEDEDLWEMYADDDFDSVKDWDSEQDDENAENYYGADYPEDEVELDDEYNEDPYRFRNNRASDEEEYDLEADAWSDDEPFGISESEKYARTRYVDSMRTPLDIANSAEFD